MHYVKSQAFKFHRGLCLPSLSTKVNQNEWNKHDQIHWILMPSLLKKIGRIKSATYFQVLTVMNSSCPMTHMTGMSEILTSYQPFHPEATYCGKDPEDICHPGYPSECDIVRHHVTHPQMAQVFPRKIFLKKHPSENILWSIRNYWLVRLVMNELMKRLHANYWAKNTRKNADFFVLEIQVELDIPMASAPTCQGTLTLETWNHPNLYIKCHDL